MTALEAKVQNSLDLQHRRFVFHQFRHFILPFLGPLYLVFGAIDYIYMPSLFWRWFSFRICFFVILFLAFQVLAKSSKLRRKVDWFAASLTLLACLFIQIMIVESGGYKSLYVIGLIVCTAVGVQIFRLRGRPALFLQFFSYVPIVIFMVFFSPLDEIKYALVQASFFLFMTYLAYLESNGNERVERLWTRFRSLAKDELDRHRRTEFLKNHFPKQIREKIEKGDFQIERRVIPDAIVGFADMAASTAIANSVPMEVDWNLKERFLEAATTRAIEFDMLVLTHLGDGFLFIANFSDSVTWNEKLLKFFDSLIKDFETVCQQLDLQYPTGVKFGVSMGPTMIGFLGKGQSYFTAIGPDVNLAARLCSQALPNEIVLSSRAWHQAERVFNNLEHQSVTYDSLKGFPHSVIGFHLSPGTRKAATKTLKTG